VRNGVTTRIIQPGLKLTGAIWLLTAAISGWSVAQEPAVLEAAYAPLLEPANWQEPGGEQLVPPPPGALPATDPTYAPDQQAPLSDSSIAAEELVPPTSTDDATTSRRGVKPYGGGHPGDWPWGCDGSPFRTGPGFCDTWDVGCRWDVAVDGIVMMREETDLTALENIMRLNFAGAGTQDDMMMNLVPATEQFDYAPGGRVWMTSKLPHSDWQMHAGYEGIEEWNASIVFPKQPLDLPDFVILPDPDTLPGDPFPEGTVQRALHYRSSLHSGELNVVRMCHPAWRPYCGVRYVKFDDEINDFLNQEGQPPLAGPRTDFIGPGMPPDIEINDPLGPTITTDRLNLFDIENNLIGFQVGVRHDLWRPNRRLAVEGFVNSGVYYNKIKYTNFMGVFTTQAFGDNTRSPDTDESFLIYESDVVNNDVRELSEISHITEASVSGVCRLNKCWALRAGYQALWVTNVHLAEDAFLGTDLEGRSLFFHGWHAGIEHRR
jgi:hypothetical protein